MNINVLSIGHLSDLPVNVVLEISDAYILYLCREITIVHHGLWHQMVLTHRRRTISISPITTTTRHPALCRARKSALQTKRIDPLDRIARALILIDPTCKTNRVLADEPSTVRIVIPIPVVLRFQQVGFQHF
ncbi:hypothetical protein SAMN06266956_1461 [Paraburkholderia hospita]|nr:hypothetical protein SAMN06266956_1461 [Paraburkholderia hospita]